MIDALLQLDWRAPGWGLLALQPLLVFALAWRRRRRLAAYAEEALQPWALLEAGALPADRRRQAGHALAWLLLAAAAAGPRLPLEAAPGADGRLAARHVMSLYVVLDVSASMQATDIAPSRLARARLELADLARRLNGERVGLIVYGGEAGILSPPADDPELLRRALDLAGPELIEAAGSNLPAALDLARRALTKEAGRARAVLLVTDAEGDSLAGGQGEAAREAVQRLKDADIPLYILGVGTTAGAPIPLAEGGFAEGDGGQVVSRMAAGPYAGLARLAGGDFVPVADGDGDWTSLYDRGLARLPGDPLPPERVRAWRELYAWCLAPALLLLMGLHLPRALPRAVPLLLAAGLALPLPDAHAEDLHAAWQDYRAGHYPEAQGRYARAGGHAGQMGAGAAAWRLKDYAAAARHFGAALLLARSPGERADALYNLGGAHYGLGNWQAAAEAYEAVLLDRAGDARARANLDRARARLAKQRPTPTGPSDLRGRTGFLAGGIIDPEWDRGTPVKEFEPQPQAALIDREGRSAAGARLQGPMSASGRAEADARRLQSGLKKLELLEDRPKPVLKGLLKQDAPDTPPAGELRPW